MSIKHEMQDKKARQRNEDGMSPGQKSSKARNRKRRISREDRGEIVRALRECADVIEATGLQTGQSEHGDYVIERIKTKPRLLLE